MSLSYQAVLLIAFGGPTSAQEIRPFLKRVTEGIATPPPRLEEVVRHYEAVGGKSPLNEITFRQAAALRGVIAAEGSPMPIYVGMRNSEPFFSETLKQMNTDGIKRALGFILSSHRTEASWERYQKNIADAQDALGDLAPEIEYCEGWHDHPLFIQTWTELISAALAQTPSVRSDSIPLIFTAHSLPTDMATRSPYVKELETSARLIAEQLGSRQWSLAYQSRSGRPGDRWLEPDIADALRKIANAGHTEVIVAPIGFVCDHVEVLYDLDIEATTMANDLGLTFHRAGCPNDHATFIRMMADVIGRKLKSARE
jgi:protoporphyrin/coproporphyrin ferrochelatase